MLFSAERVGTVVDQHPTVKRLALSLLLLVGAVLIADGLHYLIPRAYLYSMAAFAAGVETLNLIRVLQQPRPQAAIGAAETE
jgi:predicted tellurium resistance membrane protein TerC